jgi:hypothetical protein
MDPVKVMWWAAPLTIALLVLVLVPHAVLYREDALTALFHALGGWWSALAIFAGIVVHELLHGITMCLLGRLRWADMTFGVNWGAMMPYAHPTGPIQARAYAIGTAMPGVLLGILPAAAGLATGNAALSGWGAIFLAAAAGDLMVLYTLRATPATALVRDHPVRIGCEVVHGPTRATD